MNDNSIDVRAMVGLLTRQFRLIIAIVVLITTTAAVAIFTMPPGYNATALLLVDPSRKNLLEPEAPASPLGDSARIDGEVEILRSDHILLQLLQQNPTMLAPAEPGMVERIGTALGFLTPSATSAADELTEQLSALRSALSIQRRGNTYLIAITARSPRPATAASIANALADTYVADQLASKIAATLRARDILEARVAEARTDIASFETRLDQFIADNIEVMAAAPGTADLTRLNTQIAQLTALKTSTAADLDTAARALANDDWAATVAALKSEPLAALYLQRTEQPPTLPTEASQLDAEMRATAERQMTALRQTIELTENRATALRQDLRRQVLDQPLPAPVIAGLYELQRDAELAREQYLALLQRVATVDTQASLQLADSRVVSPALEPRLPSPPGRLFLLAIAAAASLILAAAAAFVYENYLGGFTSAAQLVSVLKLRVAAAIPLQKNLPDTASLADLVVTTPMSDYANAIRKLRAYLFQLTNPRALTTGNAATTILVTSTEPEEGNSTTALALARAYALSASSVVLIDCHLRQPRLHQLAGVTTRGNLHAYLSATTDADLLSLTAIDSLTPAALILGDEPSIDASEQLLAGQRFERLLQAARSTYDVVVLDTPPLAATADSLYLAPHADAVVFVVRAATTRQPEAKRALTEVLEATRPDTRIVAVLNQQTGNPVRNSTREPRRATAPA